MNIYHILISKPHNQHYLNRYYNFILYCLRNNLAKNLTKKSKSNPNGIYMETHHILPKAKDLFYEFKDFKKNPWNKIDLTPKQHYISHLLLWKSYGGSQTLALNYMNSKNSELIKSSRLYEILRLDISKKLSEIGKNKKQSLEHIKKRTESRKNNGKPWVSEETLTKMIDSIQYKRSMRGESNPFYGKKHNEKTINTLKEINKNKIMKQETKDKISITSTGKIKKFSLEGRLALSETKKGKNNPMYGVEPHNKNKKQEVVECPKCGKKGGKISMKGHHFDKCRF